MDGPRFRETAAAGYDATVGEMTRRIVPALLRAARVGPGMRVLDMATSLAVGVRWARRRGGPPVVRWGHLGRGGAPAGCGQAIARTEVFPEAATRTVTLGWRSRITARAASCAAWACSWVSQNRTEAPRVGSSSERSQ
jgi:hypothetical protein